MLAVWNQQKNILRTKSHIFSKINYQPFDGTKFTNNLENTNKKFNVGKSWYIDMLRRKSNTDLEKLWYSLLREKLAIQSDKYSLTQKNLRIRDEVRNGYSKVCISMARIKTVLAERKNIKNEFNMLLEYWYIRNKQLSNNKFEWNKNIIHSINNEKYERKAIEEPKNKRVLMKELKILEKEKDLQLKKIKQSVIEEKEKEVKQLKDEIQEKVLNQFIKERERLKKLKDIQALNKLPKILGIRKKLDILEDEIKRYNVSQLSETKFDEKKKVLKKLNNCLNLIVNKEMDILNSSKKSKDKFRINETYDEIEIEEKSQKIDKSLSYEQNDNIPDCNDIVNFKKNPISKIVTTEIQKQKLKKPKKVSSHNLVESKNQEDSKIDTSEENIEQPTTINNKIKIDIETFKKSITRKERRDLTEKINKKLRGKVIRLDTKYRSVLYDHNQIVFNQVSPYRRILYNKIRDLNDFTKISYENKISKPQILQPVKLDSSNQKYQDILLGKIKAPISYMRQRMNMIEKNYVTCLTNKEVSQAKCLIQKKNRKQILSHYLKNYKMLGKTGQLNAYNKIQKVRSKQSQEIFLKELSALKYHIKQPLSVYKKFSKNE